MHVVSRAFYPSIAVQTVSELTHLEQSIWHWRPGLHVAQLQQIAIQCYENLD